MLRSCSLFDFSIDELIKRWNFIRLKKIIACVICQNFQRKTVGLQKRKSKIKKRNESWEFTERDKLRRSLVFAEGRKHRQKTMSQHGNGETAKQTERSAGRERPPNRQRDVQAERDRQTDRETYRQAIQKIDGVRKLFWPRSWRRPSETIFSSDRCLMRILFFSIKRLMFSEAWLRNCPATEKEYSTSLYIFVYMNIIYT